MQCEAVSDPERDGDAQAVLVPVPVLQVASIGIFQGCGHPSARHSESACQVYFWILWDDAGMFDRFGNSETEVRRVDRRCERNLAVVAVEKNLLSAVQIGGLADPAKLGFKVR